MSEPKRRFLERSPLLSDGSPTIIAAGTAVRGDICGQGQFIILGDVHGDGDLHGVLHLAVSAHWFGNIQAQQAIIAGKVEGALVVEGKLEIGLTAVIRGSVTARTIAIAEGAIVDGEIKITSETPIVRFAEKRRDP